MKLISSREAVQFLSQAAPKPWVYRVLRWMAFDEGLTVYSSRGKIQPYTSVMAFTGPLYGDVGEFSGPKMDEAINENFAPEFAAKLIGKNPHARVDDDPEEWDDAEEPRPLDPGFFLYCDHIDWDAGVLRAEYLPSSGEIYKTFFNDDGFFQSEFENPSFEAEVFGLCFEFGRIEMLLPSFELRANLGFRTDVPERKGLIGRPRKWDWDGAMAYIVAEAQHPDGLPTGPGAQARIEEKMAGWFIDETGNSPAPSQIRQRAAKIIQTLEKPKTPKNN